MKKLISMLLTMAMFLSFVPTISFAENDVKLSEVTEQQTKLSAKEEQYIGNTVNLGSNMYTLQNGDVYVSKNYGRDTKLADGEITWLVEDNGFVYWSKLGEHSTTDIVKYDPSTGGESVYAHLFVPVEAFDVAGDDVYYLYNGEITKFNTTSNEETISFVDKTIKGFYLDNTDICIVEKKLVTEEDNEVQLADVTLISTGVKIPALYYTKTNLSKTYKLTLYDGNGNPLYLMPIDNGTNRWQLYAVKEYYTKGNKNEKWVEINFGLINNGKLYIKSSDLKSEIFEYSTKEPLNSFLLSNMQIDSTLLEDYNKISFTGNEDWELIDGLSEEQKKKAEKIETKEEPDQNSKTQGSIGDWIKGLWNDFWNWVGGVFGKSSSVSLMSSDTSNTVRVVGTVTNPKGQWYMLANSTYVKKSEFDKYFRKKSSSAGNYNSNIVITPTQYPTGNLTKGKSFPLRGTIRSNYNIASITAEVINTSTGRAALSTVIYPNSREYSITSTSTIDRNMTFGTLPVGTYYLKYTVKDVTNSSPATWQSNNFNVVTSGELISPMPGVNVQSIEYGQRITVSCGDSAALIHYTVNGGNEKTGYGALSCDFTTAGTYNISAWTTKSGCTSSAYSNKSVSVSKAVTPQIGNVQYGMDKAWVTISGNDVKYTTNGNAPTKSSTAYTGTLYFNKNSKSHTLKAIATRYGYQNSDVAERYIDLSVPGTVNPALYNTKEKIAQGKTATVRWKSTARAASYTAYLYYNGSKVDEYKTTGLTASFKLPEVGVYEIRVAAENFKGFGAESETVTVESMAPVKVSFVDKIIRDHNVNDEVIATVQERVNEKRAEVGEEAENIEGNVIAVQTIDYDSKPQRPVTPSKPGFTFAGYEGLDINVTEDKIIDVLYEINYYTVEFWNKYEGVNEQIGSTQEIMYTYAAEAPTEFVKPDGYVLGGWNVDRNVSTGVDFTYVDGNIKLYTSYAWANKELPAIVQIIHAEKDEETSAAYNVELKFINNNLSDTQARAIVSLYTSDGRMVYTQTEDLVMGDFEIGETITKTIQLAYGLKVSKISAVLVRVEKGKTGGAVSEMVWTENIEFPDTSTYWGPWSDWSSTEYIASDTRQVENGEDNSKYEYRYRTKEWIENSEKNKLDGWNLDKTKTQVHYKGEKSNGRTAVYAENSAALTRTVRTVNHPETKRKQYYYTGYKSGSKYHFCSCYYSGSYEINSGWRDSRISYYSYLANKGYEWQRCYCPNYCYGWYREGSGPYYYHEKTREVGNGDGWTEYFYTDTTYTYHFWKWSNWSKWTTTKHTKSSEKEVEIRPLYRYRDLYQSYPEYDPSKDNSTEEKTVELYPIKGKISGLDKDFSGKKATVLVYKKTNTDPTEEQLEYVTQIDLGNDNSYDFTVNPKEELDYVNTSDFVVTLSIEGCDKLVDIDVIEAPIPKHTVVFYDSEGVQIGEPVLVDDGSGIDVNELSAPEKEGHRFVKWDKSLVNISRDMAVNAIYEKETYPVIFVDHENETTEIVEVAYGSSVATPVVESVEGKTFAGWDKLSETGELFVNGSEVVTAVWNTNVYKVTFCDFNGNIISEQDVLYGESANVPEPIEDGGVIYSWDTSHDKWWDVTDNMTVYPYVPQTIHVDAPTITASTDESYGIFVAEIETSEDNAKIYYTIHEEITHEEAKKFVGGIVSDEMTGGDTETVSLLSENSTIEEYERTIDNFIQEYTEPIELYAGSVVYAFTVDADGNISPISVFQYEFNGDEEDEGIIPNEFIISEDASQITIPTIKANPGETVTIPVEIKNNPGLTNLSLLLGYDTESLTLDSVENGNVFEDWEFTDDVRDDGSCKFAWKPTEKNTNDGILLNLSFTVGSDVKADEFLLDIMIDYNDETTEEEHQIITVPGSINGGVQGTLGDVNGDEEVDFADAIQVLKFDAGLTEFEDDQLAVGDVNGDEEVDFADAIQILKFDAGLIKAFRK